MSAPKAPRRGTVEKSCEFLFGEEGARVIFRPPLPFIPDAFEIRKGVLVLSAAGDERTLRFEIPEDDLEDFREADSITIIQFNRTGGTPESEIEIQREDFRTAPL